MSSWRRRDATGRVVAIHGEGSWDAGEGLVTQEGLIRPFGIVIAVGLKPSKAWRSAQTKTAEHVTLFVDGPPPGYGPIRSSGTQLKKLR